MEHAGSDSFKIVSVLLTLIFGIVRFLHNQKLYKNNLRTSYLSLIDKLDYDSDKSKLDMVRSELFSMITGQIINIHHVNIMLNTYDSRRLLEIYKKAPAFVRIKEDTVIPAKRIDILFYRWLIVFICSLQIIIPILYLLYMAFGSIKFGIISMAIFFIVTIIMVAYGVNQIMFINYVKTYFNDLQSNIIQPNT